MCLVQVNRILLLKFLQIGCEVVLLLEATEDVLECSCNVEVELFEPDFLIFLGVIIRVENGGDVLGFLRFLDRLDIV